MLNGTSSAGKTTLATALQARCSTPDLAERLAEAERRIAMLEATQPR